MEEVRSGQMLEQQPEMNETPETEPKGKGLRERLKKFKWNPRAVFTKKHLVLASLIVVLGVAVYLNWTFTRNTEPLVDTAMTDSTGDASSPHYGDVQQVEANAAANVYFEEARLNRSVSRDTALSQLEDLIANEDITSEDKQRAVDQAADLAMDVAAESRIESLVVAKGFTDCIAYISGDTCSVVVQSEGLLASEAAQIKDIILRESDVPVQNISITEVN